MQNKPILVLLGLLAVTLIAGCVTVSREDSASYPVEYPSKIQSPTR